MAFPFVGVNESPPVFNSSPYSANVPEGAQIATSILDVIASDADNGVDGRCQGRIQEFWLGGRESSGINRPTKLMFQIHLFYRFSYF